MNDSIDKKEFKGGTIRFLHAADLHLDSPFEALPDEKARERRREQRLLLEKIATLAEEKNCDLLLLSGDIFDSDTAYLETVSMLKSALSGHSFQTLIAPGNHDYYSPTSPYGRIGAVKNLHVFSSPEPKCIVFPDIGARVWGAAFTSASSKSILGGFRAESDPDLVDILLIHGDTESTASMYNPISPSEIASSNMDYIALGHLHAYSGLRREGNVHYAWPGCPEGRGFDELGDKGVILGTVSKTFCEIEFLPICSRRYEILEVDVTDAGRIQDAILACLPAGCENDIYRIILRGECEEKPSLDSLYAELKQYFYELSLRDRTALRHDIWESAATDSLRGLFLRKLRDRLASAGTEDEREQIILAARYGLRALYGAEDCD